MTIINDILTLDLKEDIKNVIDLEDRSETEIQHEIESYIVTEGIGRHSTNLQTNSPLILKRQGFGYQVFMALVSHISERCWVI